MTKRIDNKSNDSSSRHGAPKNRLTVLAGATLLGIAATGMENVQGQGCLPIRNNPGSGLMGGNHTTTSCEANSWVAAVGFRFFQSDRHFRGDIDQHRDVPGTQVINTVYAFDLAATYNITPRWNATVDLPFTDSERSSMYEHGRKVGGNQQRYSMYAGGPGDLRITTSYLMLDPKKHPDGNFSLGIGIGFPTGDDAAKDIAHRATGDVLRPVDQSIQPGTGGFGIIFEIQAFQKVYEKLYAYLNGGYTMTPEEMTDTEAPNGDLGAPNSLTRFNSIPDQYLGRVGLSYPVWEEQNLSFSLGGRMEGVPDYDVIGGSMGFRRPGYIVSVEPGLTWMGKKNTVSILAPYAVYRARIQSAPEYANGAQRPGDSAFADWSILASYSYRF